MSEQLEVRVGDVWSTCIVDYEVIDATPGAYRMAVKETGKETGDGPYSQEMFQRVFRVRKSTRQHREPQIGEVWATADHDFLVVDSTRNAYMVRSPDGEEFGPYLSVIFFRLFKFKEAPQKAQNWGQDWMCAYRLGAALQALGPNAIALLCDIAERLAKGAKEHGDFAKQRSAAEWRREAYEEDLDGIVYRAMALRQGGLGK